VSISRCDSEEHKTMMESPSFKQVPLWCGSGLGFKQDLADLVPNNQSGGRGASRTA